MTFNTSEEGLHYEPKFTPFFLTIRWIMLILTTIVANGGLAAVIHFEWFGGDPQKRSLVNRQALSLDIFVAFAFHHALLKIYRHKKVSVTA